MGKKTIRFFRVAGNVIIQLAGLLYQIPRKAGDVQIAGMNFKHALKNGKNWGHYVKIVVCFDGKKVLYNTFREKMHRSGRVQRGLEADVPKRRRLSKRRAYAERLGGM